MNHSLFSNLIIKFLIFILINFDLQISSSTNDLLISRNVSSSLCASNNTIFKLPTSYLASFNRRIDSDLDFYREQLQLIKRFKFDLRNCLEDSFKDNLKIKLRNNLTKFIFNKRCLYSKLGNSTLKKIYKEYLNELQVAFNQFEHLSEKLDYFIRLNLNAKVKINKEINLIDNYIDNGFYQPIKNKLKDYAFSIIYEIELIKEQIKFHFFNFFFLTKLILAKERLLIANARNYQFVGPFHTLATSNRTYQIKIIDIILKKGDFWSALKLNS